jgi:signal transduction histidine kinase
MELLRRTVRGISPEAAVGVASLEEICNRFSACEVAFSVHGNTGDVPIHAWGVLEPCLKEALTNAARHEAPRRIDVSLDVGPHIVRLCVYNPMRGRLENRRGIGLQNLSERAKAVGGSIAIDTREGFSGSSAFCPLEMARREGIGGGR